MAGIEWLMSEINSGSMTLWIWGYFTYQNFMNEMTELDLSLTGEPSQKELPRNH
jgi:hypothetical protein